MERVRIIEQPDEPYNDFDKLPVGTVFKKTQRVNEDGTPENDWAWIPEGLEDGQEIDWDCILSEREIRHYIEVGRLINLSDL